MHLYLCYFIAYNNFTIFLKSGEKMVRRLFSYVVHSLDSSDISILSTACDPFLRQTHYIFISQHVYACFAFSALFWAPTGWFMPQCGRVRLEKAAWASVLILYFLMEACVVTDVLIYSRDTAVRERPRESPQDSWATLSSNPSTFQRHNSPPLFTSILTSAYSFIFHSSLPPSHSQPLSSSLSSPDPTLQPTERQHFASSFALSLTAPLAFLSLSSSKRDRHVHSPDESTCNTFMSLKCIVL